MCVCLVAGVSFYQTLPDDQSGRFLESHSELDPLKDYSALVSGGLLEVLGSPGLEHLR